MNLNNIAILIYALFTTDAFQTTLQFTIKIIIWWDWVLINSLTSVFSLLMFELKTFHQKFDCLRTALKREVNSIEQQGLKFMDFEQVVSNNEDMSQPTSNRLRQYSALK